MPAPAAALPDSGRGTASQAADAEPGDDADPKDAADGDLNPTMTGWPTLVLPARAGE